MHPCREEKAATLNVGKQKTFCDSQNSGKHFSHSWKSRQIRRTSKRYSVTDVYKSQTSTSDSESNSDEKAVSTWSKHRRASASSSHVSHQHQLATLLQQPLQYPCVDGMSSSERSRTYMRHFESLRPCSEMLTDSTAFFILNGLANSPFDLCQVLLSLLEKICNFDITISHHPGLTVNVVPKLTEILIEFYDCCGPGEGSGQKGVDELAAGWGEEPIALVQRMLLRTILHLMSADIGQSKVLSNNLRQNLGDLLRAILKIHTYLDSQDLKAGLNPLAPRIKKTQEVQEDFSFSSYCHQALLLPELLEGVLQFLLGCLEASVPNPFSFSQALELIHEFVHHHGLELFEETCLHLEALGNTCNSEMSSEVMERLRSIISGILKIISVVKRAKSEQIHQSSCARRHHRRCEYSQLLHHHHDVSGLPVTAFKQATENNLEEKTEGNDWKVCYPEHCCILAVCAHKCLQLLPHLSPSGPAVLQILAGVQAVGICCCLEPHSVLAPLLQVFQAPGLCSHQSYILNVLSRLVLEQLGGEQPSVKSRLTSCNICILDSSQKLVIEKTLQECGLGEEIAFSTSPCSSFQSQVVQSPIRGCEDMFCKWDSLKAYQEIVFGKDWQLSKQIASHVCQLTLRGNAVIQWKLYTYIFCPMLQKGVELAHLAQKLGVSKTCSKVCTHHTHCLPVEVLVVYLQTLPCLLKSRYDLLTST